MDSGCSFFFFWFWLLRVANVLQVQMVLLTLFISGRSCPPDLSIPPLQHLSVEGHVLDYFPDPLTKDPPSLPHT